MKCIQYCLLVFFLLFLYDCNGQQSKKIECNKDTAIKIIGELSESKLQTKYIDSISHHKRGLSFMIDSLKIKNEDFYEVKTGYNGEFHWETYHIFYVNKNNCKKILINEVVSGNIIPIDTWRKLQKQKKMETKKKDGSDFADLFNESSNIKFTPSDLNKNNNNEVKEFKIKLNSFEAKNPTSEDFNVDDLSILINNETFTNNEAYVDSSWLDYFINKYKIDYNLLYGLMDLALKKEDYRAVKIILNHGYIISKKEIKDAELSLKYYESLNGKIDTDEFYDPSFSQISKIYTFIKSKYLINHIEDPDGYTNLRKEKNASSEILQKIQSGETIEVLDNTGDWFQVKTKKGKTGYVHKSRIKSGNNNKSSASLELYDRPDFSSFSKEILVKEEIEIVHQNLGWNFIKVNGITGYLPTEEKKEELLKEDKKKFSFLAEEEDIKPEKKKGFWDNLFG
ncbi:hypothetical protein ASG22_09190 [Chryseobacterium sp. Leaf405]|uniref:SH3 domain-containing protein n=1 Tax=Chryseobacterium sp. Leaf405 TaxID=1736367 RepID=UPI0006FA2ABA|nr:SH3 domain-containing protein [Chryseobacterium sp. Leaf405]KQT24179.1 hypothetical protein ASG22_09190 [Chryseobacterium sp. Leaf405]